jgi:hypothetical protein
LLEAGDDGNATGDGGSVEQMRAFGAGEAVEFDAVFGDELFVAGDGGFSGFKSAANPGTSGLETACEFNDDVNVGAQDFVEVLGPDNVAGDPVDFLAGDAAVEDVRELKAFGLEIAEDARNGAANGSESQDGDLHVNRVQGGGGRV